jgi:TetR/AcrR family transcriptional regulator
MDNRSILLDSALALFADRGYDAVGVQEIVDAAGVTKPTLYHYFGSKPGLLRALLATYHDQLNEMIQAAADYHHDLPLTLRRIVAAYFKFASEHTTYYRMILSLWFAPRDSEAYLAVAGLNENQFAMIETLFQQAANDHGNMRGRHKLYAASFLGTINNAIALFLNEHLTLNDVLIERMVHQFEHGIYS